MSVSPKFHNAVGSLESRPLVTRRAAATAAEPLGAVSGGDAGVAAAIPLFLVWKGYQRRAETLSKELPAELVCMEHRFQSKAFRGLDYGLKLARTLRLVGRDVRRPVIVQAPPAFAALGCLMTGAPYLLDVHNALFQSFWEKVPLTGRLISGAAALIAHNSEAARIVRERNSGSRVVMLPDPLLPIGAAGVVRDPGRILLICSFDRDEPLDLIVDLITAMQDYRFFITANPSKAGAVRKRKLEMLPNLTLTGFLPTQQYHELLLSSGGAVVLTSMEAVQPSGACEALSSDTPLVVSRTRLTMDLFGRWAAVADNDVESLVGAIRSLPKDRLDLSLYRKQWADRVDQGLQALRSTLAECSKLFPEK